MFSGSIVALVTPFTDSGGVDYAALGGLLEFHLKQGSDGLVVAGTTGESATLNQQEFRELLATVVREVDGAVPVRRKPPRRSRLLLYMIPLKISHLLAGLSVGAEIRMMAVHCTGNGQSQHSTAERPWHRQ